MVGKAVRLKRNTRVTRAQKRVGHKVWRVWWEGAVDGSATKKARRQLREKASDKRGSRVVRIHENKNSTELEFASKLKYDAVMRWLQEVTESSKCRLQGCDCSLVDCRAAVSACKVCKWNFRYSSSLSVTVLVTGAEGCW